MGHEIRNRLLAVEVERTRRNVLRNIDRDFSRGSDQVLIVCPDLGSASEVARLLAHHSFPVQRERISLATISALRLLQPL